MILKTFSTDQFAGISDVSLSFMDGMNVILGNNEAGKSTAISAMYAVLNKSVKLDRRSDKTFLSSAFPTNGEDTVDGTLVVESQGEECRVKKVWDKTGMESSTIFKRKDSGKLMGAQAESALKMLLQYGPAVYDNLIFGRQNNEEQILEWCYNFFSANANRDVEEAKKVIAVAFSAIGGISPEKLATAIDKAIKDCSGNWDSTTDRPAKNDNNGHGWQKGNGTILTAYYAFVSAQKALNEAKDVENRIVSESNIVSEAISKKAKLTTERDQLVSRHGAIEDRANIQRLLEKAEIEKRDADNASHDWPEASQLLVFLESLKKQQTEKSNREKKATLAGVISSVKALREKVKKLQEEIDHYPEIEKDHTQAESDQKRCREIVGALTSAKLRATLSMEGGNKAVVNLADGSEKEVISFDSIDTDGYVQIVIPGVASIRVAPQDLDVDALEAEKKEKESYLLATFKKYGVSSLAEFDALEKAIQAKQSEKDKFVADVERILGAKALEDYESDIKVIITDDSLIISDSLEDDIDTALRQAGKSSIDAAIGATESTIGSYKSLYSTLETLKKKQEELSSSVRAYQSKLQKQSDAPQLTEDEYEDKIAYYDEEISATETDISDAQRTIGSLSEREVTDIAGLEAEVEERKLIWNQEKKKLAIYSRIRNDFDAIQATTENRFEQFYQKFNDYLGKITGKKISLKSDLAGLSLQSGSNGIDSKDLLSEGTRKTVLLAFRLAVLGYFFPEGGGFVVLDDDLLDMDPERRKRSAELLQSFASNNQVIFTTCDPAIAALLGGNLIKM